MPDDANRLEFFDDPADFLQAAGRHLAADPVVSTVLASVTERMVVRRHRVEGLVPWWALVRDEAGAVVGTAMRTAPFEPHPLYLLPMPEAAVGALARALHERGESMPAANGALPAVLTLGEETARLRGGHATVSKHTRLFGLPRLITPPPVQGTLRAASPADLGLATKWFQAFHADAEEQAGRGGQLETLRLFTEAEVADLIADKLVWLWEVEGEAVHVTGWSQPAFGVVRVGPVYTPSEQRGCGYASAAVAEVSQRILAAGHRACLFTDQANPTSNRIYESLGYRRVVDMAEVVVRPDTARRADPITTPAPA